MSTQIPILTREEITKYFLKSVVNASSIIDPFDVAGAVNAYRIIRLTNLDVLPEINNYINVVDETVAAGRNIPLALIKTLAWWFENPSCQNTDVVEKFNEVADAVYTHNSRALSQGSDSTLIY